MKKHDRMLICEAIGVCTADCTFKILNKQLKNVVFKTFLFNHKNVSNEIS